MFNNIKSDSNNKRIIVKKNDGMEIKMPIINPDKKNNSNTPYNEEKEEESVVFQKTLDIETEALEISFKNVPHYYEQYYYYQLNQTQMNISQTSYQFRNNFKTKVKKKD